MTESGPVISSATVVTEADGGGPPVRLDAANNGVALSGDAPQSPLTRGLASSVELYGGGAPISSVTEVI